MNSILDCKEEPVSPFNIEEVTWSSDTEADLYWTEELLVENLIKCDSDADNKAEIVTKLLENLDQLQELNDYINEDNEDVFSNYWMEDRNLPMFEESMVPIKPTEIKSQPDPNYQSTQSLLTEFQTVFDSVNGALTPPQSPLHQQPTLITLEPAPQATIYSSPNDHTYPTLINVQKNPINLEYVPATPQPDVAHELAVVEELVRTRVEILVPSSPSSSASSVYGDSSSDDPEWSQDYIGSGSSKKTSRHKTKPYSRNSEDKKSRKKEQNKNAATRYRLKKKAEVEEILGEEKGLQDKKGELETNINDLQREIKCLKSLMRDLFKAKGLIN